MNKEKKNKKLPFNTLRKGVVAGLLGVTLGVSAMGLTGCSLGGEDGKNGTQWLSGTNAPVASQGVDGDFYLDIDDYKLYQKENGQWGLKVENFGKPGSKGDTGEAGQAGQAGQNGQDGEDGDTPYISNGYWWIGDTNTGIEVGTSSTVTISKNGELLINGKIVDEATSVTYENLKISLEGFTITREVDLAGKWPEGGSITFNESGYIDKNGALVTGNTWVHSDLIPLSRLNGNIGKFVSHTMVNGISYYSSNSLSSYISGKTSSELFTSGAVFSGALTYSYVVSNAPSDAQYVVFSTNGASNNTLTVDLAPSSESSIVYKVTPNTDTKADDAIEGDKLMHFSFDDTIQSLRDLTENKDAYTSLFDSPFFGALKEIHDEYGAVFSCYCFYNQTEKVTGDEDNSYNVTFSLSQCTDKFADEFTENADWLRFGFHSKSNETYYSKASGITAKDAVSDYENVITELIRITGSVSCIDTCIRLQSFTGTEEICLALRDASMCGVTGFLTGDYSEIITTSNTTENINTSSGYYLTSDQAALCGKKGRYFDYENQLFFFASNKRLDNTVSSAVTDYLDQFNTAERYNRSHIMEMYAHENQMIKNITDYKLRLKNTAEWATKNGYVFGFSMDKINQML